MFKDKHKIDQKYKLKTMPVKQSVSLIHIQSPARFEALYTLLPCACFIRNFITKKYPKHSAALQTPLTWKTTSQS